MHVPVNCIHTLEAFIVLSLQLLEKLDTVLEELWWRLQLTPEFPHKLAMTGTRVEADGPPGGALTWQHALLPFSPLASFLVPREERRGLGAVQAGSWMRRVQAQQTLSLKSEVFWRGEEGENGGVMYKDGSRARIDSVA